MTEEKAPGSESMELGPQTIRIDPKFVTDHFAFGDNKDDGIALIGMTPERKPIFALLLDKDTVGMLEGHIARWRREKGLS